jgi:hypothetical protein
MSGHVSAYLFQRSLDRYEMSWGYVNGRQSAYLFRLNLFADLCCHKWPVVEHADAQGDQIFVRHTWLAVGSEHLVCVLLDRAVLTNNDSHIERHRETEEGRYTERQRDRARDRDSGRESEGQTQTTDDSNPRTPTQIKKRSFDRYQIPSGLWTTIHVCVPWSFGSFVWKPELYFDQCMKSEALKIPKLSEPRMVMAGIAVMVSDTIAMVGCCATAP